jgi:hypothetical protein
VPLWASMRWPEVAMRTPLKIEAILAAGGGPSAVVEKAIAQSASTASTIFFTSRNQIRRDPLDSAERAVKSFDVACATGA